MLLAPASCRRAARSDRVNFPPTPILTIRSAWAAVKSPYLRVREEPSNQGQVISHIRMGTVVEVVARSDKEDTVENETAFWLRINCDGLKGWAFGSYLEVFDSRADAEKFASALK
jgi:hypothetical protein